MKQVFNKMIILLSLISGVIVHAQSYGDYTFYSPRNTGKAYLVDLSGNNYHTWTFASNAPTGYSSYLLQGGTVLRTVAKSGNYFTGGPICGEVQKVDWNGNVIWDYVYSTPAYCSHHDICAMPNGNVLLIAYETKTPAQVTQAGCSQNITIWPDKIVEIQPSGTTGGTVVWEWHIWDHLCQNYNPAKDNYVTSIVQHPELLNINYNTQKDWMHVNGIDYNDSLDQITFSSHALNEIYVIDHSTNTAQAAGHTGGNSGKGGDLLYRWGNPAAYQATGTTIFNVVHDAHWVPKGCPRADYLSGFNNKGGVGNKTCVDLFHPPYSGYNYSITPGSAYTPPTYNWRHTYSGTPTQDEGNAQQLPNGNTLICISFSGYIYEIDSNQTVVWSKTISGTVTNAFRYTACYVNGPLTVTASASSSLVCPGSNVQLTATASGGTTYSYSWTSNPPGFTSTLQNPVATPAVNTTYTVNVTSGTCSGTNSVPVNVYSQPSVSATAYPPVVCSGTYSQLDANASGGTAYTFSWVSEPPGFTSNLQNPVAFPTINTTYKVTVTSCGLNAHDSTLVVANPLPGAPVITQVGDTLYSSSSTGNQWFYENNMIAGATGNSMVPLQNGNYTVQVTDQNGCVSQISAPFNVTGVGFSELISSGNFRIFPNPTNGKIFIAWQTQDPDHEITIFTSTGEIILQQNNPQFIDLSPFGNGIYFPHHEITNRANHKQKNSGY